MSQDTTGTSFGSVYNYERIARGGFHNKSINQNTGNVRPSLIDKSGLHLSQFSVWRLGARGKLKVSGLVSILKNRTDLKGELCAVLSCKASDIKAIVDPTTEGRALCVVDECECDPQGNLHAAHAHIALCRLVRERGIEKTSENFQQIVEDLHLCFVDRLEWANSKETSKSLSNDNKDLNLSNVKYG